MLSMIHMSQMTTVARRWGPYASKPQCVVDYNIGMKGVDLGDQLSSSYPSIRRSLKWYNFIYLFTYLTFPLWTVTPSLNIWETGLPKSPFDCGLVMQSSMSIGQLWSHTAMLPSASWLLGRTRHVVRETPDRRYRRCFLCYWVWERWRGQCVRYATSPYAPTGVL